MTETNMTEAEIMKALECCSNASWSSCHECPYREKQFQNHCAFTMSGDALDLINRKNAEIERARTEAIKEFAERAKENLNDVARWQFHGDENEYFIIGKPFIDEIAKEMGVKL